ncbi:hypothetical protein [Novosphingobium sp. SG707]|uniref:hypothetical protein n=1 Tax=Novosphingobium sp. SG707 TaxID=2586996 RepID=UPI0014459C5E|nr:hypothetical protein [Novosphingobium sp. SG707]NKI99559.1 hypothetical protein [Novosphingobium sp. SG707]
MTMKLPLIALGGGVMALLAAPVAAHSIRFAPDARRLAPLHGEDAACFRLRDPAFHADGPNWSQSGARHDFILPPSLNLPHAPACTPE